MNKKNQPLKKLLLISAAASCLLCLSCAKKLPVRKLKITTAQNDVFFVNAEIAKTTFERNRGFMERKNIPDGTGMLFVFEKDQFLDFWMKDTPHPLSIAYIDSSGKIRDIFDMTPFSLASVSSTTSVRYALEVPQGWFEKNNIRKGDFLTIEDF